MNQPQTLATTNLGRLGQLVLRLRIKTNRQWQKRSGVLDHYVDKPPSAQNAIDAMTGWVSAMPSETGLRAGTAPLFADTRIDWLLRSCFSVAGKSVLELGPLEGLHTYMLARAGAASIDAIEANAQAFLRCLITKEVLKIERASFHLGDFLAGLEASDKRYDLVVASGVLYHSHDPVRLLELIAAKSDAIFLWTHFFDEQAMPRDDLRRLPFSEQSETRVSHGVTVRLYERSYLKARRDPSFCGGLHPRHYWVERADLLDLLAAMGFSRLSISHEEPNHRFGPSFCVFAERPTPAPLEPAVETASVDPL